jgi:hypothetical protein
VTLLIVEVASISKRVFSSQHVGLRALGFIGIVRHREALFAAWYGRGVVVHDYRRRREFPLLDVGLIAPRTKFVGHFVS